MTPDELAYAYMWGRIYHDLAVAAVTLPILILFFIGFIIAVKKGWLK